MTSLLRVLGALKAVLLCASLFLQDGNTLDGKIDWVGDFKIALTVNEERHAVNLTRDTAITRDGQPVVASQLSAGDQVKIVLDSDAPHAIAKSIQATAAQP